MRRPLRYAHKRIELWVQSEIPEGTLRGFARDLRRLQKGESPLSYRTLTGLGSGVAELKRGKFRVVYTTEFPDFIGIAAAFKKDAGEGDKMRSHHKTQIKRGLAQLREGEGVPETKALADTPTLH